MTSFLSTIEQFHHENQAWLRSLDFYRQENAYLKNRLSDALDHSTGGEFLAMAEQFQNQFLLKDEFINELLADIQHQEKILKESFIKEEVMLDKQSVKRQAKFRNEMENLEKSFISLKIDFNKWLVKTM